MVEPGFTFSSKWESSQVGIPYGSRARLILFYLQTEAIRGQTPEVNIGPSLSNWLGRMGISRGGLSYQAVREQCRRLSACRLTIGWNADDGSRGFERANIVNKMMFVPNGGDERQGTLWDETVRLSPEFYQSLVSHPVPVAEQGIKLLCNSSLSMDIYVWLAYRLRSLTKPTTVSWAALHQQFGPEYANVRAFRARFNENLREALCVYPDARIDVNQLGVVLHSSPPAIPERASTRRLRTVS
jgi:Plasmid encoded RepA protein